GRGAAGCRPPPRARRWRPRPGPGHGRRDPCRDARLMSTAQPEQRRFQPAAAVDLPLHPHRDALEPRLALSRQASPAWARPALLGLLSATALLYLWNLSASGWANAFY